MANQTTISDLEEALADVCAREELLERELEDARSAKEAFRYVLAVLNRTRNPTAKPIGIHGHIRPSQIRHYKNQIEAWEEIARLSDGIARPSDGAQLLIDAGLSKGKRRSVVSTASNHMGGGGSVPSIGVKARHPF